MSLLRTLLEDEKKIDKSLYSSGSYWNYKNKKTIKEIQKKGILNFRGLNSGVGTSFTDNIQFDTRNELGFRGRILSSIFSFPLIKKIYNNQLKITKNIIDDNLKMSSIIYSRNLEVQKIISKYKFENTTEFDCIRKFNYQQKEYSSFYIEIANRIKNLSLHFDFSKIKSFFEIGGGFGANIHFLLTNFPNIKKIIYLDAVPNIFVGTEYLKKFFDKNVKDYSVTKKLNKISFDDNNELEIICIPPWEIEKLDVKLDHFHNAASFVEMPKKVIENYCKFIKKFEINQLSLISYSNFDNSTTFDPRLLNNFFENKLEICNYSRVIKDFDIQDIYLYSK